MECSKVEKDLRRLIGAVKGQLGFNRRILVPKTMIVGNSEDEFKKLGLFTSLPNESYQDAMVADLLGYEGIRGITFRGVPTERLIGRKHGDCSILLDLNSLGKFNSLVFSQRLDMELGRKNAVVAYCLGGKSYLCADSIEFRKAYFGIVDGIRIDGRFT